MRLILASASPRRAELLAAAGFQFEICPTDVDERVRAGESAQEYVRRLAIEKAARAMEMVLAGHDGLGPAEAGHYVRSGVPRGVRRRADTASVVVPGFSRAVGDGVSTRETARMVADVLTLGADTAVIVDEEILGKPADDCDAERMLRLIAGRSHTVMTGVSLCFANGQMDAVEETRVWVRTLSDAEVAWYVASGEGRDKAGAYAIQGLASRFIPRIDGSYANVVGLPVTRIAELVQRLDRTSDILASGSQ